MFCLDSFTGSDGPSWTPSHLHFSPLKQSLFMWGRQIIMIDQWEV